MSKHKPSRKRILRAIVSTVCLTYFAVATAGGGGGASLDNKEGLERAADNFLAAFALLSITKDLKLTPVNGIETHFRFIMKATHIEYDYDSSIWDFYISNPHLSDLPKSKEISTEEYRKFRNNYVLQKNLRYAQEEK